MSRKPPLPLIRGAGRLLGWSLLLLGRTWRIAVVSGESHLEEVRRSRQPVLFAFWHSRLFPCGYVLYRQIHRRGVPLTMLISQSRDGELGARAFRTLGGHVVRGSASRGGLEALWALRRAAVHHRSALMAVPDGPRGPSRYFKPGVLTLAQLAQVPILPVAAAASRYWVLRSWDRLLIPRPFARVVVTAAEPQPIPRSLLREELERERQRLEALLDSLVEEADRAVTLTPPTRRVEDNPPSR